MGRTQGVWKGESWEENSGQLSKAFFSVGTNSLRREAFVISPEQGLQISHPSGLSCAGWASFPGGLGVPLSWEERGLPYSIQTLLLQPRPTPIEAGRWWLDLRSPNENLDPDSKAEQVPANGDPFPDSPLEAGE